ncbi:MAG: LD-carboxypeptidase [Calditrichaeota bacterium]|nr:MAG: LD-carboxypeptidase [Calditrichota bacterium]MBL1206090.1 LD-carboxypeptidase [Calditrichota bacterium]NOG45916.1 LD-carboxypeptidase [Calditrichota bacterium]
MQKRRDFLKTALTATGLISTSTLAWAAPKPTQKLILPPALKKGDTIGLITPGSSLFEARRAVIEATEKMNGLGFKVKLGKNIYKKNAYLAGTIEERVSDIHDMFSDDDVSAIITIRGGYGSGQLLPYLNYDLIRNNPKILVGYSDITSLLIGIYQKTGLVTFHGPVAVSTFTDFTKKYFYEVLSSTSAVGQIDDAPYEDNLQNSSRILTINGGKAKGKLIGGNMTLLQATLGTPYEFDSDDSILFFEEVGEEPYNIDRILNHFKLAGKFDKCKGVIFDKMPSVKPSNYSSAFYRNFSVEEVLAMYFKDYDFPVCIGFSLGHIKHKPTMPIGVMGELDADAKKLSIIEPAVTN